MKKKNMMRSCPNIFRQKKSAIIADQRLNHVIRANALGISRAVHVGQHMIQTGVFHMFITHCDIQASCLKELTIVAPRLGDSWTLS
jgi:hypothetical protein